MHVPIDRPGFAAEPPCDAGLSSAARGDTTSGAAARVGKRKKESFTKAHPASAPLQGLPDSPHNDVPELVRAGICLMLTGA